MIFKKITAAFVSFLLISECCISYAVGTVVPASAVETPSKKVTFLAMDTAMELTVYGDRCEEAAAAAQEEIERLDSLWSIGSEDSEISQLNAQRSMVVSEDTFELLREAVEVSEIVDGLFDVSVYPIMLAWGFTGDEFRVPGDDELASLLPLVDYTKISFDDDTLTITLEGDTQVEVGGIAKGYTSARIVDIFEEYDITCGLINLGGNIECYHKKTDGSDWRIGIQNPDSTLIDADYAGIVSISDKCAITSGGYERYFEEDGIRYHHIIDPRTGKPADSGLISVTIVSEDPALADGLSTSLFIMGLSDAINFWRECPADFDFILIDDDGNIYVSAGLEDSYSCDLDYDIIYL